MASASLPSRAVLLAVLQDCYAGPAWYGTSLLGTLRTMQAQEALRRPTAQGNSIWELVLHLAYTRYLVLRRLGAAVPARFPRPLRSAWWPRMPAAPSAEQWQADLTLLAEYHERLLAAVRAVSSTRLRVRRRGQPRPLAYEVLGVAVHDAYHVAQIRLIQRLRSARPSRRRS